MSSCWLLSAALLQSLLLAVGGLPQQQLQQQQDSNSRLSPSLDSFRTSCGIASTQQRGDSSSSSSSNSTSSLFPWLVGISTSSSSLSCSGAFVSPNVVAAPAHCVAGRSAEDVKVEIISR